ncbi:MAG: restriction endonuclease subunit M, partial [Tannerella sp.]
MRLSTDTKEGALLNQYPDVLAELLKDHTTGRNIFWATDNYASQGEGYGFHDEITIERITGLHTDLIRPRALKSKTEQKGRTKDMAEVFTPTWVCNRQANLLDEAWFGRPNVFNVEDHAAKTWRTVRDPIAFPPGKTWRDYIRQTCLEITCGEAPYLVSRYDAADGHAIPLADRIGLLDRKLRVVSEHVSESGEWLEMAQEAYK